ncbi:MAG TPA: hypothetical protein VEX88_14400 [Glaciibacter sp.]|nr:hypothetical protein [Glaciibacter sp.]
MPPVREILLAAHTGHVDEQSPASRKQTRDSWETGGKRHPTFDYWRRNTPSSVACEAYDYSRDLAIEDLFRFAARNSHPGTHAETQNVNFVVNPTERERTGAVDLEVDGEIRRVQS